MLLNYIKRIHRQKKKEDNDDVPLVQTKFHTWKTTQSNLKEIIYSNKNKKSSHLSATNVLKSNSSKNGHCLQNQEKLQRLLRKERVVGICELARSREIKYSVHSIAQ